MHSITMILKNSHPKLNNSKLIEPTNPTMIIKSHAKPSNSKLFEPTNPTDQQTDRQTDIHSMDLPRVLVVVASTKCKRRVNPIPKCYRVNNSEQQLQGGGQKPYTLDKHFQNPERNRQAKLKQRLQIPKGKKIAY